MKIKLLAVLFLFTLVLCAQNDWELIKEKDGVKVYLRNYKSGKLKEFKAVGKISATLNEVNAVLKDFEHAQNWMVDLKECKLLKKMPDGSQYKYFQVFVPFPLKNRDMIYHEHTVQDKKTKALSVTFTSTPDYVEEKEGIVRMVETEGSWKFEPISKNELNITYQLYADPSGVPAWIVNMMMVDSPIKTIQNMRNEVKKEIYKTQKFSYIHE